MLYLRPAKWYQAGEYLPEQATNYEPGVDKMWIPAILQTKKNIFTTYLNFNFPNKYPLQCIDALEVTFKQL